MSERGQSATVRDVMTTAVSTISPETRLKEAAAILRSGGFSALPVVDRGGRVIGVLSEADLLVKAERPAPAATQRSYARREQEERWTGILACHLMSRPAVTVAPDAVLAEAAHLLHRHGLKRLPVVDDAGRPVGIVSRGDLLKVFLRSDEDVRRDVLERVRAEAASAGLPAVTVKVEDGVVTLRGVEVESGWGRRVTEIAEGADGVVAVRNLLNRVSEAPSEARRLAVDTPATDIEILSEEECLELLRAHRIGRIALSDHGQPLIFPVNYAADDRAVVFRTAPGMKLTESPMTKVAFEIDEVDTAAGTAWSVLVQGVAYEITSALDSLSERLRELVVEPMAPGEHRNWVAVTRHEISGRRFRLHPIE
jgi:CBS domain-containing protein